MKIALATCADIPGGDPDDQDLRAALDATFEVWSDAAVDWRAYDRVVLRSAWDYPQRLDEFLAWADAVGPRRLVNPPDVLRWNTDKRYLTELHEAGLPVVQTSIIEPGMPFMVPGDVEFVVKPSVSAGSRDTARFSVARDAADGARASALVGSIHESGRTALIQPYVPSVDERGETALLYFGGEFSHAAHKGPLLEAGADPTNELFAPETMLARVPSVTERELGDRVSAFLAERFGGPLAYARVDVVAGDDQMLVLEVEAAEPSLFFAQGGAPTVTRAAAALRA